MALAIMFAVDSKYWRDNGVYSDIRVGGHQVGCAFSCQPASICAVIRIRVIVLLLRTKVTCLPDATHPPQLYLHTLNQCPFRAHSSAIVFSPDHERFAGLCRLSRSRTFVGCPRTRFLAMMPRSRTSAGISGV